MRKDFELFIRVRGSDDTNFDVLICELSLEAVLKSKNGSVNGIFNVEIIREALFQEALSLGALLAKSGSLPAIEGP